MNLNNFEGLPSSMFYTPLTDAGFGVDEGDPYICEDPQNPDLYHIFTTGQDVGGAFHHFVATRDFSRVEYDGTCLEADLSASYWAPCVVPTADGIIMLFSKSLPGEGAHVGHSIFRAFTRNLEVPFHETGHNLTPAPDRRQGHFIDPDVYRVGGKLMFACAMDRVSSRPVGTCIAEAQINEDLTKLVTPLRPVLRATSPFQLYERNRHMPWKTSVPSQYRNPDGTIKEWYCVEAPVGGLVSPMGNRIWGYSGGNYGGNTYFGSTAIRRSTGRVVDGARVGKFLLRAQTIPGLDRPGHFSKVPGRDLLLWAGDFGRGRQMFLTPLAWDEDGWPYCPTPD